MKMKSSKQEERRSKKLRKDHYLLMRNLKIQIFAWIIFPKKSMSKKSLYLNT